MIRLAVKRGNGTPSTQTVYRYINRFRIQSRAYWMGWGWRRWYFSILMPLHHPRRLAQPFVLKYSSTYRLAQAYGIIMLLQRLLSSRTSKWEAHPPLTQPWRKISLWNFEPYIWFPYVFCHFMLHDAHEKHSSKHNGTNYETTGSLLNQKWVHASVWMNFSLTLTHTQLRTWCKNDLNAVLCILINNNNKRMRAFLFLFIHRGHRPQSAFDC